MKIRKLIWIGIVILLLMITPSVYFWDEVSKYDNSNSDKESQNTAIVLGAALWNGVPSPALQERLDEAYRLYKNDQVKFIILSGGLGKSKITEAEGMRRYLINKGIPQAVLIVENKSRNTWQNLLYSSSILKKHKLSKAYIVTHDYHMSRAMYYAHKINVNAVSAPVHSKTLVSLYHKFRESYALLKEKIRG